MPSIIEIKDEDNRGSLAVALIDLLDLLKREGHQLTWSILELEATGDPNRLPRDMLDLEQEVEQSPNGVIMSWEELVILATAFCEVLNAVIVGCKDATLIPHLQPNADLYTPCEIVLEAIDSTLWRVYARDDQIIQRLQTTFRNVVVIPTQ
jgi:hypothetical protein